MNCLEVPGVGAADLVPPEWPVLGLTLDGKARTRGDGPPQALLCLLLGLSPHLGTPQALRQRTLRAGRKVCSRICASLACPAWTRGSQECASSAPNQAPA